MKHHDCTDISSTGDLSRSFIFVPDPFLRSASKRGSCCVARARIASMDYCGDHLCFNYYASKKIQKLDHSQKKLSAFFNTNAESTETAQDRETGRNNADDGLLGGAIRTLT